MAKMIYRRNIERIFLLVVTVVFGFLFNQLFTVLTKGFYYKDKQDIGLVSSVIEKEYAVSPGLMDNTGELNKSKYFINADEAFTRGGESFKKRVKLSRALLGFSENDTLLFDRERTSPMKLPPVNDVGLGPYKISGSVQNGGHG